MKKRNEGSVMEIQINSCPVDFSVENEKNASEVLNSISKWATDRDLVLTEAWINNSSYSINDVPDIPIGEVNLINCVVQSRAEIAVSSINDAVDYCGKSIRFIENALDNGDIDREKIDLLRGGIDWIAAISTGVAELLGVSLNEFRYRDKNAFEVVDELMKFGDRLSGGAEDVIKLLKDNVHLYVSVREILKILSQSEHMRNLLAQSPDSPDSIIQSLHEIKSSLPGQINNLIETAVAYQTGKDGLGSEKIQIFIDFIYKLTRTCQQAGPMFGINLSEIRVDGTSLADKSASIEGLLREIVSSLESNDIISLADILEYEMKPLIEGLEVLIGQLIEKINR
jgi:hypothetical protein